MHACVLITQLLEAALKFLTVLTYLMSIRLHHIVCPAATVFLLYRGNADVAMVFASTRQTILAFA